MSLAAVLAPKLRKFRDQLPFIPETLALLLDAAPRHAAAWLALLLAGGLLPVFTVYLGRAVVDALSAALRTRAPAAVTAALLDGALLAAVLLAAEVVRALASWVRTAQSELLTDRIYALIHQKSAAVDLAFYDSAEFYDHLHRARWEAAHRPLSLLDSLAGLLQNGLTLACMLAVLLHFGPLLPLALAASTVPAVWVVLRANVRHHRWRHRAAPAERRAWYYDWVLTEADAAPELRLFDLSAHFRRRFSSLRSTLRSQRLHLLRQEFLGDLCAGALALTVSGLALLFVLRRALAGHASLGDVVLFFTAWRQGLGLGRTLLENLGQLYINSLFLENLFEFLHLQPAITEPSHPVPTPPALRHGIEIRDISFQYPGSDRPTIEQFSLFIPARRITAVVGANGSGKSTLLKLLCRFYDPAAGAILLDGTDLREFSTARLRRLFTTVFQDPVRYNTTARENIALGDIAAYPDPSAIARAARAAGLEDVIERLPHGYDTLLGRRFDAGAELSVGEWQRLALARAFVRQAPILLLDEPTSAMDPWAEAAWLADFRRVAAGRTAVLITHRFTTAVAADFICVLRGGQLVESGSHQSLLAQNGLYRAGWDAQLSGPLAR